MFLPENSSENDEFYNLGKDWQYETTEVPNKFWLRIRYYQESINLWLDKETERAYQDQISPRNRAIRNIASNLINFFIRFFKIKTLRMILILFVSRKKFFQLGFK